MSYIAFNSFRAFWSVREVKRCLTAQDLEQYVVHLLHNMHVTLGNTFHQQLIGMHIKSSNITNCVNINFEENTTESQGVVCRV